MTGIEQTFHCFEARIVCNSFDCNYAAFARHRTESADAGAAHSVDGDVAAGAGDGDAGGGDAVLHALQHVRPESVSLSCN